MALFKEPFCFNLSELVKYTKDGDPNCETASIFLLPPSLLNIQYTSKLEQLIVKAAMSAFSVIVNLQEDVKKITKDQEIAEEQTKEANFMDKEAVKAYISAGNIEFIQFFNCFKEFLLGNNAFLDEECKVRLKQTHFDQIDVEDIKEMMYEYLSNFIKPSMFSQ